MGINWGRVIGAGVITGLGEGLAKQAAFSLAQKRNLAEQKQQILNDLGGINREEVLAAKTLEELNKAYANGLTMMEQQKGASAIAKEARTNEAIATRERMNQMTGHALTEGVSPEAINQYNLTGGKLFTPGTETIPPPLGEQYQTRLPMGTPPPSQAGVGEVPLNVPEFKTQEREVLKPEPIATELAQKQQEKENDKRLKALDDAIRLDMAIEANEREKTGLGLRISAENRAQQRWSAEIPMLQAQIEKSRLDLERAKTLKYQYDPEYIALSHDKTSKLELWNMDLSRLHTIEGTDLLYDDVFMSNYNKHRQGVMDADTAIDEFLAKKLGVESKAKQTNPLFPSSESPLDTSSSADRLAIGAITNPQGLQAAQTGTPPITPTPTKTPAPPITGTTIKPKSNLELAGAVRKGDDSARVELGNRAKAGDKEALAFIRAQLKIDRKQKVKK